MARLGLGLGGGVIQGAQEHGAGPVDPRAAAAAAIPPARERSRRSASRRSAHNEGPPPGRIARSSGRLSQKRSSTRPRASSVRTQSRSWLGLGLRR